jgi:flagellar biosynthesis protein FlhB
MKEKIRNTALLIVLAGLYVWCKYVILEKFLSTLLPLMLPYIFLSHFRSYTLLKRLLITLLISISFIAFFEVVNKIFPIAENIHNMSRTNS